MIHLDEIDIDENLNFVEESIEIMDREVKRTKQSRIPLVKVRWNAKRGPEFTWEREDSMKQKYLQLFLDPWFVFCLVSCLEFRDEIPSNGGDNVTTRNFISLLVTQLVIQFDQSDVVSKFVSDFAILLSH